MNFTIDDLEFFLLILVRISGFVFTAPFLSLTNVPRRVQIGLSVFMAIIMFESVKHTTLEYQGVIGYAGLVIIELFVGLVMGFIMNGCIQILAFSGQIIDMEIGFSMVNVINPTANISVTVTGNLYTYFVMLMLLATDLYRYIITAIIDTFQFIPVGQAVIRISIYQLMITFIKDYFVIGFRIVLPMFAATLMVNVVLGVLAKVAPQMNMFVIGMQLKVLIGLIIIALAASYVPVVADLIYGEMRTLVKDTVSYFAP
ncbi:MAG: flagellar biosynthetic protein FliR [Lachnospiraceae bacterium]|nr:flagellar biosynthetic protein FliR [Lachnospiraceae bacterium]